MIMADKYQKFGDMRLNKNWLILKPKVTSCFHVINTDSRSLTRRKAGRNDTLTFLSHKLQII